jgi:hypothetical protein
VEEPTPIGIADFVSFAGNDVYAFGGGIAHWNGQAWTLVEPLAEVDGPSLLAPTPALPVMYGPAGGSWSATSSPRSPFA